MSDRPAIPLPCATFYGTACHKVSGRNQVAIPRQHKHALDQVQETELLLVRWQNEAFLRLYPKSQFDLKINEVKQNASLTLEQRNDFAELLAASAEPVEPDSQGRFVLPAKWVDALNIREEVVFRSAFSYVKIWPAEATRAEAPQAPVAAEQVTNILNG